MADLDGSIGRIAAHEGAHAAGLAGVAADEGIEPRVARGFALLQPGLELLEGLPGAIGHVGPDISIRVAVLEGGVEVLGVALRRDGFEHDPAAVQRAQVGLRAGRQRLDDGADGAFGFLCHQKLAVSPAAKTFTLPAAAESYNVLFILGLAQNFTLDPNASEVIYLNGTALTGGYTVVNTAPAIGAKLSCFTFQTGASSWAWSCESRDTNFVSGS